MERLNGPQVDMSFTQDDRDWMGKAIVLAATHVGKTGTNPSVGCLVVRDGVIVGQAVTGLGGGSHAEEQALTQAGAQAARSTVYVTLEPCAQRSSGAASCSERLIGAGVAHVLVACQDPSINAAGLGIERLRGAGIGVQSGLLEEEAKRLYADYRPAGSARS